MRRTATRLLPRRKWGVRLAPAYRRGKTSFAAGSAGKGDQCEAAGFTPARHAPTTTVKTSVSSALRSGGGFRRKHSAGGQAFGLSGIVVEIWGKDS